MSKGTADKIEGRLKEASGALLDDDKLKSEGQAKQIVGDIKDAIDEAGTSASELVEKAADLLKGK